MKYKLGIIGAGVMGQAIMSRIIDESIIAAEEITVFDIDTNKVLQIPYNISIGHSVTELINNSEMVLFAVKPQHYSVICENNVFPSNKIILSIMAGVKISTLRGKINNDCGIVRIMPNTPCKLGEGVCALCFDKVSNDNKYFIKKMFSACGATVEIAENNFDAVTSVSGSGPAYVYMFADALIKGGIDGGLSYEQSKILALNTIIGTAKLALGTTEELDILTDKVCSKGGTTIEAVNIYKEKGLKNIVIDGIVACRNKSKELSETL